MWRVNKLVKSKDEAVLVNYKDFGDDTDVPLLMAIFSAMIKKSNVIPPKPP